MFSKKQKSKAAEKSKAVEVKKTKEKTNTKKLQDVGVGSSSKQAGHWSSKPLLEYVIPDPIPDLNKIAMDPSLDFRNFFKDIPDHK